MGEFKQSKMAASHKCGSKMCWGIATGACIVIGLILIILAAAMGGCSCSNVCEEIRSGGSSCTNYMDGCNKGYDANKCAASMINSNSCTSDCDTGGMAAGAFIACIIFGIIILICGCVFICGIVPCCCFAGPEIAAAGAPAAATAAPVEGVVVQGKM